MFGSLLIGSIVIMLTGGYFYASKKIKEGYSREEFLLIKYSFGRLLVFLLLCFSLIAFSHLV